MFWITAITICGKVVASRLIGSHNINLNIPEQESGDYTWLVPPLKTQVEAEISQSPAPLLTPTTTCEENICR